jgi:hypothetical protein
MCLRFVFLLVTQFAASLRLSRREEAWKSAEILICATSSPSCSGGSRVARS